MNALFAIKDQSYINTVWLPGYPKFRVYIQRLRNGYKHNNVTKQLWHGSDVFPRDNTLDTARSYSLLMHYHTHESFYNYIVLTTDTSIADIESFHTFTLWKTNCSASLLYRFQFDIYIDSKMLTLLHILIWILIV